LVLGQEVKVNIHPKDSFKLQVLGIYPDSFPLIATIFKAENRFGEPLWLLNKNELGITENKTECRIVTLRKITDQTPIKVGLVIDHSGSMNEDIYQLYDTTTQEPLYTLTDTGYYFPNGYIPPIESAKNAVLQFINSLNQEKDSIQIVGFSSRVDKIEGFTNDTLFLSTQVDSLQAYGGTALYDAIYTSIESLRKEKGIKVIIALTDGLDNESSINPIQLLDSALKYEIPIFNVALGNAVIDTLQMISDSTGGSLYYSKSAIALTEIYEKISEKILAIYELRYLSENMSSIDSTREFDLRFKIDSLQLIDGKIRSELPREVIEYLEDRERSIFKKYATYGGIGLGVLIIIGGFFLYNKKGKKLLINSIYPNPSASKVIIDYKLVNTQNCRLVIIDVRLRQKLEVPISELESSIELDISNLSRGVLLARIIDSTGRTSNTHKLLKK